MKLILKTAFIVMLASLAFAGEKAPKSKVSPEAPKPTLIFFMNPNGSPCQMQDQILLKSKADLEKLVQVRYVKTTIPTDREIFYQYGIRSLPNLILTDAQGKELHRFAPGIQEIEVIMNTLTTVK
jgi:thioredoxin 1